MTERSGHTGMWRRVLFFVLVSGLVVIVTNPSYSEDEYYCILIASHGTLESAQRQFKILKKKLPDDDLTYLRIEKIGDLFSVRLGRFIDRESALALLKKLKPQLPGAVIRKVPLKKANIIAMYGEDLPAQLRGSGETPSSSSSSGVSGAVEPSAAQVRRAAQDPAPRETKEGKPSAPSKKDDETARTKSQVFSRSVVRGTVTENRVAPSGFTCSGSKGVLYLIMVYVEETEDVANYENFLWDKKNRSMSFFAAERQPAVLPGKRIRAIVEYRGDERCRLYWIEDIEILP